METRVLSELAKVNAGREWRDLELQARIEHRFSSLEAKIDLMRTDMIKWGSAQTLGVTSLEFAIARLVR
jgi:hypothetical protein